jgi:hypothetical protein
MPKGYRKRGEFEFTIWFEDGAKLQWKSMRSLSDRDTAAAIRRYLLPVAERIESRPSADALNPSSPDPGTRIRATEP